MKVAVGVVGSADPALSTNRSLNEAADLSVFALGMAIALRGCALVTDGFSKLPYEAVKGAKVVGGHVIGIIPDLETDDSHQEYLQLHRSPASAFDALICSNSGPVGRAAESVYASDLVVVVGGGCGTLSELAIAYDRGTLMGVLEGTGGIAEAAKGLVPPFNNQSGAVVLYDDDPVRLVDRLLEYHLTYHIARADHSHIGAYTGAYTRLLTKALTGFAGTMVAASPHAPANNRVDRVQAHPASGQVRDLLGASTPALPAAVGQP